MAVDFDEAKIARNATGMWLGWMLATALGLILAYVPAAMLIGPLDLGIARVLVPLLAGVIIGLAQWLFLRRYVSHSFDWVFNLAASWVAGYTIALFVVDLLAGSFLGMLLGFILFGVIVALFQWPVLHREIPSLWMWILANVVGWTLGALLSQLVIAALFGNDPSNLVLMTFVNSAVVGLVAGLITGLALVRIVREPEQPLTRVESRR
jgi:hypothetical protein